MKLKVFSCEVYGECTLGRVDGIAYCHAQCADFQMNQRFPDRTPQMATGSTFQPPDTNAVRSTPHPNQIDEPVQVIIPGGDDSDLTKKCLSHLAHYGDVPLHVVYLDLGGQPDAADTLCDHAAELDLSFESLGHRSTARITQAINEAIQAGGGRHVLLLQPDTFIGPGCLPALKRPLEEQPSVAAVGPLTGDTGRQSLHRGERRESAGLSELPDDLTDPVLCAGVCRREVVTCEPLLEGFCCLLHKEAIAQVGLLSDHPDFAAGLGLTDWCRRARRAGWNLLLCHDAFAAHLDRPFSRPPVVRAAVPASNRSRPRTAVASGRRRTARVTTAGQLPECDSRHALDEEHGAYVCLHPQVYTADRLVTAEICSECRYRNQPAAAGHDDLVEIFVQE